MRKKLLFPVLSIILIFLLGILALDQYQVGEEAASNRWQENKIDLLSASVEELIRLPGIGPAKAQAIINYRQEKGFREIEDIMNVSGIGEKTFSNIKDYIYLSEVVYEIVDDKININEASSEELESLPGIGKVSAQKIIEYRAIKRINSLDDLGKIGIPSSTIEKIEGKIVF
ncbi:ComEA family DNA-binding protein [Petrotoga olearia]|uniref:Competence protein ComEA n=2 Tax=Petrotoga olearia TaxID=156203 RepID=A0A2K1NZ98_9BACT|nr:helix-hairpin-helix domain-containing protein [Petrotoga olearia]PNR95863.1 competence protein ComEA [Petrotoga olearia DSM 13574]RMA72593.1 competence protein ComEA [Petrotoga olearia]